MTQKTSIFQRNPGRTLVVVLLFLVGILDVAAGLGYRVVFGHPYHYREMYAARSVESLYRNQRTVYHHDLAKKFTIENAVWGDRRYEMATDSLGFKNAAPIDVPLESSKHRILFIGDSFTEGIGVSYPQTFVGLIGEALRDANVEVMNAAVASYSPMIYWRKIKYLLEEIGLDFDELVVFIDISDIQDEAQRYVLTEDGAVAWPEHDRWRDGHVEIRHPFRHFVKSNTMLTYYLLDAANDLLNPPFRSETERRFEHLGARYGVGGGRSLWTVDGHFLESYGEKGLEKARHYMDKLFELTEAHGKKLTIAVYPWPTQIVANDLDSRQVRFWAEWARERGIPLINYFPCFVETGRSEGESLKVLDRYYIPGDSHWTERGHEVIADGFLRHYRNGGTAC